MARYMIETGPYSLDITTDTPVDEMEDTFPATCNDTGEQLLIHGWLIEDIEEITDDYDFY